MIEVLLIIIIYVLWSGFNDMHYDFYVSHNHSCEALEQINDSLNEIKYVKDHTYEDFD